MGTIFDYVFYRLAKFYYRWDRSSAITAIIGLSFVQNLYVGFKSMIIIKSYYSRIETSAYSKRYALIGSLLLIATIIANFIKYNKTYPAFRERWLDESRLKSLIKGVCVLFFILLPLLGMLFFDVKF